MQTKVQTPIKIHGGKHYGAKKILPFLPPHLVYCEPYFGGGSLLLAKDYEGTSEVVNDIDGRLTNFWRVLQSDVLFPRFERVLQATPFSEEEYDFARLRQSVSGTDDMIEYAVGFFVLARQSLAGRQKGFTSITKTRVRRGMNNEVSAWLTAIDGLPAVHERMKRVLVLNRDALDVIRQQDSRDTLIYADPPYLSTTRTAPDVYEHEMTEENHKELLSTLGVGLKGKFILSGYRSDLYDREANIYGWNRHEFEVANHAAGGKEKKKMTECIWMNF